METDEGKEKCSFIKDYLSEVWGLSELCERYGISRPTGYRWIERYQQKGKVGLENRSHAHKQVAGRTGAVVERRLVALRKRYGWGAKKLLWIMEREGKWGELPAVSTANSILDRHGLVRRNRRQRRWEHPATAAVCSERPNQVWPADFKGQFRTGDHRYCWPLTVTDHFSRKLLMCKGLPSTDGDAVRAAFGQDLGYQEKDRMTQVRRIQNIARMLSDQGLVVLASVLYSHPELHTWNRTHIRDYFEVYLDASLALVRRRDSKKLYSGAERGQTKDVVGVDIPWHVPAAPDLVIDADQAPPPALLARQVVAAIPWLASLCKQETHG